MTIDPKLINYLLLKNSVKDLTKLIQILNDKQRNPSLTTQKLNNFLSALMVYHPTLTEPLIKNAIQKQENARIVTLESLELEKLSININDNEGIEKIFKAINNPHKFLQEDGLQYVDERVHDALAAFSLPSEGNKVTSSSKPIVVLHITGPGDKIGTGIVDYCDKLLTAQRRQGIEAYYVLSNNLDNIGKLNDSRYIVIEPWSVLQKDNEQYLERIEERFNNKKIVWYIHLAPPVCGTAVSPEWLLKRNVTGTIHECKIPEKVADPKEKQKAQSKLDITVEYANTFSNYMISNLEEVAQLQKLGINKPYVIQAIPPNIDPRIADIRLAQEDKLDTVVHFGMIRAKKGIEEVLAVQDILDKGKTTKIVLLGKVTEGYFDMFVDILIKIYGKNEISAVLQNTEFKELFNATQTSQKQFFAAQASTIVEILRSECKPLTLVDFYPNASEEQIFKLLRSSKVAYLPFDRGATFHSGTLPACILSDLAIVTTMGNDTPDVYRQNLCLANNTQSAAAIIQDLISSKELLNAQLLKQESLKQLYPSWSKVAQNTLGMVSRTLNFSRSAETEVEIPVDKTAVPRANENNYKIQVHDGYIEKYPTQQQWENINGTWQDQTINAIDSEKDIITTTPKEYITITNKQLHLIDDQLISLAHNIKKEPGQVPKEEIARIYDRLLNILINGKYLNEVECHNIKENKSYHKHIEDTTKLVNITTTNSTKIFFIDKIRYRVAGFYKNLALPHLSNYLIKQIAPKNLQIISSAEAAILNINSIKFKEILSKPKISKEKITNIQKVSLRPALQR